MTNSSNPQPPPHASPFLAAMEKLAGRTSRRVIPLMKEIAKRADDGTWHEVIGEPMVPFLPRYLVCESPDFEISDMKIGARSIMLGFGHDYACVPTSVFSAQNIDEWISKGAIPERYRLDAHVAEPGHRIVFHVRQRRDVTTCPYRTFRAVLFGDSFEERRGWKGSLTGRISAVGTGTERSFVEISTGGAIARFSLVRIPIEDGEATHITSLLGRTVRLKIECDPEGGGT